MELLGYVLVDDFGPLLILCRILVLWYPRLILPLHAPYYLYNGLMQEHFLMIFPKSAS